MPISKALTTRWTTTYPKVEFKGHARAIPYLLSASITSIPLNGETYHAGEYIEVTLQFSIPATTNGDDVRVPLWLGDGADNYRGARFVPRPFDANGWRSVAVYEVLQDDRDTDGVILGEELLWVDGAPLWMSAADTDVPVSTSFEFATVDTQPVHPVDGSMTWDCEQLFCAYPEFAPGANDRFGYFTDAGRISSTFVRYQGEEFIMTALVHEQTDTLGGRTRLRLNRSLTDSERAKATPGSGVFRHGVAFARHHDDS